MPRQERRGARAYRSAFSSKKRSALRKTSTASATRGVNVGSKRRSLCQRVGQAGSKESEPCKLEEASILIEI